jgi:hypothetical protein
MAPATHGSKAATAQYLNTVLPRSCCTACGQTCEMAVHCAAELVWRGYHQDSCMMTVPQPSHCLHTQLFCELRVCWQCTHLDLNETPQTACCFFLHLCVRLFPLNSAAPKGSSHLLRCVFRALCISSSLPSSLSLRLPLSRSLSRSRQWLLLSKSATSASTTRTTRCAGRRLCAIARVHD